MKNREEPSVNSRRGNPCEQADLDRSDCVGPQTTSSLSRPGRTVAARTEQPALRCRSKVLRPLIASRPTIRLRPPQHGRTSAYQPSLNRRMRTRMSGGVVRAISDDGPYPIIRKCELPLQPSSSRGCALTPDNRPNGPRGPANESTHYNNRDE